MNENTSDRYVFLSYASADRDHALAIADRLEAAGIHVWVDRRAIPGAASWGKEIVEGIEGCAAFILCCSEAALSSRNVTQEIQLAWEAKRPYLPLLLDRTPVPNDIRYFLVGYQWVEVLDRPEQVWIPDVLRALAGLGLVPARAEQTAEAPTTDVPEPPHNLPQLLTRCIGRDEDTAELRTLFQVHRLVTLTGPGGTGKTRLALEVATSHLPAFRDGVWFVDLAPLHDPDLVISAIASAVGVRESLDRSLLQAVKDALRNSEMLLVLDNFEQVLAAAPVVSDLLAGTRHVRVLVTSRALLHLRGEQEFTVMPLAVPAEIKALDLDRIAANPAVALFVERARAAKRDFVISPENTVAVVEICQRLDGLPLAIELAAARIRSLAPVQLAARLENQLPVLTGGGRDLPSRHRTMRATIAWSYDLLEPTDRSLFEWLAVFRGGFSLKAMEAVCSASRAGDILDGLTMLIEHSLVIPDIGTGTSARYRMLEPIREFAVEQLHASGQDATARAAHAAFFRDYVSQTRFGNHFTYDQRLEAVARIKLELDNIRAALDWYSAEDVDAAIRFASALGDVFAQFGFYEEGRYRLTQLLALNAANPGANSTRANALLAGGNIALTQGDYQQATEWLEEAVDLFQTQGRLRGVVSALTFLGAVNLAQEDLNAAARQVDTALNLVAQIDDVFINVNPATEIRGYIAMAQGDTEQAGDFFQSMFNRNAAEPKGIGLANAHRGLGHVALSRSDLDGAKQHIRRFRDLMPPDPALPWVVADWLALCGQLAMLTSGAETATQLLGASASVNRAIGRLGLPTYLSREKRAITQLGADLGDDFDQAWQRGRALSVDDALSLANTVLDQ